MLSICCCFFQGLKIDDRQTRWDFIHDENLRRGENKYSTLQKVSDFFFLHLLRSKHNLYVDLFISVALFLSHLFSPYSFNVS